MTTVKVDSNPFNIEGCVVTSSCDPFVHPLINLSVKHVVDPRDEVWKQMTIQQTQSLRSWNKDIVTQRGLGLIKNVSPAGGTFSSSNTKPTMSAGGWACTSEYQLSMQDWPSNPNNETLDEYVDRTQPYHHFWSNWTFSNVGTAGVGALFYGSLMKLTGDINMSAEVDFPLVSVPHQTKNHSTATSNSSRPSLGKLDKIHSWQGNKVVFQLENITTPMNITAEYWWVFDARGISKPNRSEIANLYRSNKTKG